jgi:hypothetical protein
MKIVRRRFKGKKSVKIININSYKMLHYVATKFVQNKVLGDNRANGFQGNVNIM